ncbi:MAG: hypothetical protein AB1Z81_13900 [Desulfotignum sp.]
MMGFAFREKTYAGIEISEDSIRAAAVIGKAAGVSIQHLETVKIPTKTLTPAFKHLNVKDLEALSVCLKKACPRTRSGKIHVALPDACVKVLIQKITDLPKEFRDIGRMLLWRIASTYGIPEQELRVSWENWGKDSDNRHVFLVAVGMEPVLAQYEAVFEAGGMRPVFLAPAGLARFNFYAPSLPDTGVMAYLGLFDEVITLFVFLNGLPLFYRITRKGMLRKDGGSAINDVDLLIQYYNSEFPENEIEKFFIASYIKSENLMEQVFENVRNIDFIILDETQLIHFLQGRQKKTGTSPDFTFVDETSLIQWDCPPNGMPLEDNPLPFYTTALGAAQKGIVR